MIELGTITVFDDDAEAGDTGNEGGGEGNEGGDRSNKPNPAAATPDDDSNRIMMMPPPASNASEKRPITKSPSEVHENTNMFVGEEATHDFNTTIYLALDMVIDAFCLGWLNGKSWTRGSIFASALTGQTVKTGTEVALNGFGLSCIPAFLLGNLFFALLGPTILCAGHTADWGMTLHEETFIRRAVFKSMLEILYVLVTVLVNLDASTANSLIVVMSFAAGVTNGFHSRNMGQATAFMTGRVAKIGTELGLFLRGDGLFNRIALVRNACVYVFFLLGALATRTTTAVALAWPFHVKYVVEMTCLLVLHLTGQKFPMVQYTVKKKES